MGAPARKTANSGKSVAPPKGLTPWKPGQSGNPNGRPKDRMRPALRAQLTDEDIREINKLAIQDAKHPDPEIRAKARAWLVEQTEGKLTERQERVNIGDADKLGDLSELTPAELRQIMAIPLDASSATA